MKVARFPHGEQFFLVEFRPLFSKTPHPGREPTIDYVQSLNCHCGLVLVIAYMEMRRIVVVKIHTDDDTEKTAYFGHYIPPKYKMAKLMLEKQMPDESLQQR
jgi:hypothetical protein